MNRDDKYMLACLFAIDSVIKAGSSYCSVKVDGKWENIPWDEIKKWIEKQYGVEAN